MWFKLWNYLFITLRTFFVFHLSEVKMFFLTLSSLACRSCQSHNPLLLGSHREWMENVRSAHLTLHQWTRVIKTKQKMKCKAVCRLSSQSSTVCRYIEYILFVSGAASRCVHHIERADQSLSLSLSWLKVR